MKGTNIFEELSTHPASWLLNSSNCVLAEDQVLIDKLVSFLVDERVPVGKAMAALDYARRALLTNALDANVERPCTDD